MKPMPGKSGGRQQVMAEINMVPFIDISLVLLIIFMIMTPLLVRSQIKVNLPTAKSVDAKQAKDTAVTVQVRQDGVIFIEGRPVAPDVVEDTLRALFPHPDEQPLVVEADRDVAFHNVVVVLDAAKRIGAKSLSVCVKQVTDGKKPAAAGSRGR
jgi:biopolymer transport protein ExbD